MNKKGRRMKGTKYFLILGKIVAKEDSTGDYIFKDGNWEPDTTNMIWDRLMGYDPTEDSDSPYAMGNSSIMEEIEEISCEKAMELIGKP